MTTTNTIPFEQQPLKLDQKFRKYTSCLYNDYIILLGGTQGNSLPIIKAVKISNNATQDVSFELEHTPEHRWGCSFDCIGSKIYVCGGWNHKYQFNDTYCFDLSLKKWSEIKSSLKPTNRSTHSTCVIGSTIYLFGGCYCNGGPYVYLDDMYAMDTSKQKPGWVKVKLTGDAPSARSQASMIPVGNKIYVVAGKNENTMFNDIHVIDTTTFKCTKVEAKGQIPPTANLEAIDFRVVSGHGATVRYGLQLILLGVKNESAKECSDIYVFDLITETWKKFVATGLTPGEGAIRMTNVQQATGRMFIVERGPHRMCTADLNEVLPYEHFVIPSDTATTSTPETPSATTTSTTPKFNDKVSSDFILKMENTGIFVHKDVLINKSDYFKLMFESGMAESKQSSLELETSEHKPARLLEMLRYMYGLPVYIAPSNAIELIVVANHYQVVSLQTECVKVINKLMTTSNVLELITLSEDLHIEDLNLLCIDFVLRNMAELEPKLSQIQGTKTKIVQYK